MTNNNELRARNYKFMCEFKKMDGIQRRYMLL